MVLSTKLFAKSYVSHNIKPALAKANEEKTGDQLAALAAESPQEAPPLEEDAASH